MKRAMVLAGTILVVMIAMAPAASADAMTWSGIVTYPNGTWVPHDTVLSMENLNQSYVTEPWWDITGDWGGYNGWVDGEKGSGSDYMKINASTVDGQWYGEITPCLSDTWDAGPIKNVAWMNMTVYEIPVPFSKDLAPGWNLVSLPRTPDDNSVSAVLTSINGKYDSVMKYTPATGFEEVTTMDPGVGYFIRMTESGTWSYDGYAYESMSASLSPGLNMVGWVNSYTSLPDALDSIDGSYRYVARWHTAEQKYEVYDPIAPDGFNDFDTMEDGVGYFIAATAECTLGYP